MSEKPEVSDDEERTLPPLPEAGSWLLDGFNVLHTTLLGGQPRSKGWWAEPNRRLVQERADAFRRDRDEIFVVFDGARPLAEDESAASGRLHVVYAPSADSWIARRVRSAAEPARIAVVTADHQLAARCRHAGAPVVAPRDFLAWCPSRVAGV